MGIRRLARERTLQFLYQYDLNRPSDFENALEAFWKSQSSIPWQEQQPATETEGRGVSPDAGADTVTVRAFADPLILGVITHRDALDAELTRYSKNWKLHRIAIVDRNILRLAIFELRHRADIPPIVSINEAIDLGKKYSTDESGKFINGILDRVRQDTIRPARLAS